MGLTEKERVEHLKRLLNESSLNPELLLNEEYQAYFIHSGSIIVMGNETLARLGGYTVDELTGLNVWRLIESESYAVVRRVLEERSEESYSVVACRKDGSPLPLQLKAINYEVSGEPVRVVLVRELSGTIH